MLRWTTQLIPPEFMGSHIASGRSHTTGRRHDLAFRAATAIFGHLGIEWDLAEATRGRDRRAGAPGSTFYKEQRDLLLGGDLVRMDGYDDRILVHGVVAPDRSRALFAMVALDSLYPDPRRPAALPRARPATGSTGSGRSQPATAARRACSRRRGGAPTRHGDDLQRSGTGTRRAWHPRACTPTRWCSTAPTRWRNQARSAVPRRRAPDPRDARRLHATQLPAKETRWRSDTTTRTDPQPHRTRPARRSATTPGWRCSSSCPP